MKQPIDLRPDHARIVHEIIARHLPSGASVRVFGSRAKWSAKPHSDLDLALKGKGPLPRDVLGDLAEAFSESDLPFRVDVVDWHSVAPSFQAVIDRDAVLFSQAKQWETMTLGKAGVSLIDCVHATPKPAIVGYPYIAIPEMKDGRLDFESARKITIEDFTAWTRKAHPRKDDVVLSRRTNPGVTAPVGDQSDFALGQNLVLLRANGTRVAPEFLRWLVSSPQWWTQIQKFMNVGAVFNSLKCADVPNFELPIPPKEEQLAIASTLAALDDKIELNRRMNETLERQALAIFRDWFVDFGPVRRAQAGATDPVAIMGGLTPDPARAVHLAAFFPAAFGNDGLPVGWSDRPLDSIAEFLNGLALQKHPATPGEPDLPVIKIAELRNGLTERSNRAARTLPAKYIIKDGDFIFSWSGSLMAKVWTEGEGALNQHLFKVSSDAYPQWFYALWVHHHMPEFQLIAASKATTMGHIQRMHLTNAATVCPPDPTLVAMSAVMQPLWGRMIHNELENRTLAETRDYLLPRLMSGAVRVGSSRLAAEF